EHSGVVAGSNTDEQVGMRPEVKTCEYRFEVRRTQLAGSTRRRAARRQANQLAPRRVVVLLLAHAESKSIAPA
ncbi:MAG: hypothetical protein ACREQD_14410, partial [Candidatus Binataceae bacterium]